MKNSEEDKDTISLRIDNEKQYHPNPLDGGPHGHVCSLKHKELITAEKMLNPWASYPPLWNKIFLALCVIGVSIDPLFLYIPIVNDDKKCLEMDHHMKNTALLLRSLTDFSYILHIIFRLRSALKMSKELGQSIFTGLPWSYLLIDILAILPLPQVVVLVYFAKIAGSKSLTARKFLNSLLLLQYVPRLVRVYLSAKELSRTFDSITLRVWVRGAFLFFIYIIFGHVFGAFWYFYAIFRETACWHRACKSFPGCVPGPSDCGGNNRMNDGLKYLTHLNESCPVNPTNPDRFNFGIFKDAIESRIVSKTNFPRKFSRSFWWGLRNLSSFGQNLETSSNIQENLFAVLISLLGLLIFLYLIGNLQTYIQLATTKSEEARRKISIKQPEIDSYLSNHGLPEIKKKVIMRYLARSIKDDKDFDVRHLFSLLEEHAHHGQHKSETFAAWVTKVSDDKKQGINIKEQKAELWISKNRIPTDIRPKVMRYVRLRLQEGKDVDIGHLLHILPSSLALSIKKHLCFPILKKVPLLQNMDECVFETICKFLKPVVYSEKNYIIRKGEPLDLMLLITQGVVWTFGSSNSPMECLQKGDYYGTELIEWRLSSTSYSEFPLSTANLKSHTKVEAFALMAIDLEHVLSKWWSKFSKMNSRDESMPEGLKPFAVVSLQKTRRRNRKKRAKDNQHLSIDMS